jgi:Tfp pilus assembly protein PilO
MSKSLLDAEIDAEKNYEIYDKELLAIVKALKAWRQYLIHANQQFEVWTDHENLKYFWEPQKLNARQAQWYIMLQEYNYSLRHIPGKTNTKADILSRLFKADTSHDNENIEMFKDRIFIRQLSELPSSLEMTLLYNWHLEISSDVALLTRIKDATNKESSVIQEMRK